MTRKTSTVPANDVADIAVGESLETQLAASARRIRRHALAAIFHAGSGHPGGALSCADLLSCLYGAELNVWPTGLDDPLRDRFVLSKGHAAPALYAAGAEFGFCDAKEALSLRKLGSKFQGHPHVLDLPFAETSTGSLGQGFSVALGMALGLKKLKAEPRVYALLGDGELQEGEVWEAAMCAAHHRLDNLCVIIDYNKLQSDDSNGNIMRLEPLAAKWSAFGWAVAEIDGHDISAILSAFRSAAVTMGAPSVIIAHTVKGKGVKAMENVPAWHGSVKMTREQTQDALGELGASDAEMKELLDV
jgi:transketolase